jgi:solute carrier family 25 (adenine nucleotide translocator) protein 4/5/6/31
MRSSNNSVRERYEDSPFLHNLFLGGASGAMAHILSLPINRVLAIQPNNLTVLLFRSFPMHASNFALKDHYKTILPHFGKRIGDDDYNASMNFMAGGTAGATSVCFFYPVDEASRLVKLSKINADPKFKGMLDVFLHSAKSMNGVMMLYRGLGPALITGTPYRAIYFGVYDTVSELESMKKLEKWQLYLSKLVIAIGSTWFGVFLVYPIDVARKRIYIEKELPKEQKQYEGYFDCIEKVVRKEGVRRLYYGVTFFMIRMLPAAFALLLYDESKFRLWNDKEL